MIDFDVLKLSSSSTDKDTGYQLWTVPETSIYTIKVYGAYSGVHPYDSDIHGGKGAIIECDFELQMNDKFIIQMALKLVLVEMAQDVLRII